MPDENTNVTDCAMSGTVPQVEWAKRIKGEVNAEFDRVAGSLHSFACRQDDAKRAETEAVLVILEEKRAEVMGMQQASYFIHDWQEISGQVRQMIFSRRAFIRPSGSTGESAGDRALEAEKRLTDETHKLRSDG